MIIGNCPVCGAEMRVGTDMTNADHIRAMTDEELAEWITHCVDESVGLALKGAAAKGTPTKEMWLDWLKRGASE